jgi:endonuclease III
MAEADRLRTPLPPLSDIVALLERFYGPLPSPPHDLFRLFVWETLSAQTTASRRDASYGAFQRLPALTPDAMWRMPRGKLEAAVALCGGYQEQRLRVLRGAIEVFRRTLRLGESLRPRLGVARRALAALPPLGEGSVHRMLLFAGDYAIVPVDRDVARFAARMALAPQPSARPLRVVRRALERTVPRDAALCQRIALYVRHHATQTCTEDPHCTVCPLAVQCPSAR